MATTISNPNVISTSAVQYQFDIAVDGVTASVPPTAARRNVQFTSTEAERCYVLAGQTLVGSGTTTIDLTTAFPTALTDLHFIAFVITSNQGGLRVGGTVANGNPLWFTDISDESTHYWDGPQFQQGRKSSAVAVSGSSKVIALENPTADTVTYTVVVVGDDA